MFEEVKGRFEIDKESFEIDTEMFDEDKERFKIDKEIGILVRNCQQPNFQNIRITVPFQVATL